MDVSILLLWSWVVPVGKVGGEGWGGGVWFSLSIRHPHKRIGMSRNSSTHINDTKLVVNSVDLQSGGQKEQDY